MALSCNNLYEDSLIIPSNSFKVESKTLIHRHSNKNHEEDITCSHSRGKSEETTIKFFNSKQNVIQLSSESVSGPFDINTPQTISGGHVEIQNGSPTEIQSNDNSQS